MFGNRNKILAAIEEYTQSDAFHKGLTHSIAKCMSAEVVTTAIGTRLDSFFTSSAVLHKILTSIEEQLKSSGKASIDKYIRDALANSTVHEQISGKVSEIVGPVVASAVKEHAQRAVETPLMRERISDIVGDSVKKYVDLKVPNIIKVERLDGTFSKAELRHSKYEDVLKACTIPRANVLLVGPAGSGKTRIAQDVATDLKRTFYFNGPIQSEYKLLGFRDATGNYNPTPFYNAYTSGGVYLFDEIDASSAQSLVAFNTAIANRYCDFPAAGEPVAASNDFICLAAANTYGRGANHDYTARNQLDAATLDRFIVIEIGYDYEMECALSGNPQWVDKVRKWRERVAALNIRHVISMRASTMGAQLLQRFSEQDVEEMVVWRGLDRNTVAKIKAT